MSALSLSSEGEHFFRGQRHAMRGIRRWSLVLYKIIMNFLCSSEIILPVAWGSNIGKWALGSPWLLNISVSDAHNPSSELCAFTSCSFSSDITFSKFTIAGIFWISANSMLCNTRVAVLWCSPQMAVSQKGLTSAWSSWSFITLLLKSMWAGSGHTPGKALCSHPEKNSQGFSSMGMRGSLCFVSLIFFLSLMVGSPFFQLLGLWSPSQELSLKLERGRVFYFLYDQWSLILTLPSYWPF